MRSGLIDHVYEVNKTDSKEWASTSAALRARHWGLVLSPHQSPRTLLLVRSLTADRKIGYRNFWASFVFNTAVIRPMNLPEALRQLALLQEFDSSLSDVFHAYGQPGSRSTKTNGVVQVTRLPAVPDATDMTLAHFTDARSRWQFDHSLASLAPLVQDILAREKIDGQRSLALLAPGSVWNTKRWTPEGYIETAQALIREGWRVLLIGAPDEKELCQQIASKAPGALSVAANYRCGNQPSSWHSPTSWSQTIAARCTCRRWRVHPWSRCSAPRR